MIQVAPTFVGGPSNVDRAGIEPDADLTRGVEQLDVLGVPGRFTEMKCPGCVSFDPGASPDCAERAAGVQPGLVSSGRGAGETVTTASSKRPATEVRQTLQEMFRVPHDSFLGAILGCIRTGYYGYCQVHKIPANFLSGESKRLQSCSQLQHPFRFHACSEVFVRWLRCTFVLGILSAAVAAPAPEPLDTLTARSGKCDSPCCVFFSSTRNQCPGDILARSRPRLCKKLRFYTTRIVAVVRYPANRPPQSLVW